MRSHADSPAVRRAALQALSQVRFDDAAQKFSSFLDDPDEQVQLAAVNALADCDGEEARKSLVERQVKARPGIRKAIAKALHKVGEGPVDCSRYDRGNRMADIIRNGLPEAFEWIDVGAIMRYALPKLGQYEERDLTRRIAAVCGDYAATRRKLIEEGLMTRQGGVYEFTPLGERVWKVEQHIVENMHVPDRARVKT